MLVKQVKGIACLQFFVSAINSAIVSFFPLLFAPSHESGSSLISYSEFLGLCRLPPDTTWEKVCAAWAMRCKSIGKSLASCNDDGQFDAIFNEPSEHEQGLVWGGTLVSFAILLCCASCVPACGFVGARDRQRSWLMVYIIFNLVALAYAFKNLLDQMWQSIGLMILYVIAIFWAWKLHTAISNPIQQQPLVLVTPGQYTQPVAVQPKPVAAQPGVELPPEKQVQPTADAGQQSEQP